MGCQRQGLDLVNGWASGIKIWCDSEYGFIEVEGDGITKEQAAAIGVGAGAAVAVTGVAVATAIGTTTAVAVAGPVTAAMAAQGITTLAPILVAAGPAGWVIAGIIAIGVAIAVLLAIFLPEDNWWQKPKDGLPQCNYEDPETDEIPNCPRITCNYTITCNAFK